MSGIHAKISPSFLSVLVACHAALKMSAPYANDPPTEEELEGEAAHWAASMLARGHSVNVGTMTPQGLPVDEDMLLGAQMYSRAVGLGGVVEMPVAIPRVHAECWGTPDHWRFDEPTYTLYVPDYKYGHKFVDVYECWQLMAYAVGILEMLGLDEMRATVVMTIVQPRSYHKDGPVRSWKVRAALLRGYINRMYTAAHAALEPEPKAVTGNHCLFCRGRRDCTTLQRSGHAVADFAGTADQVSLPPYAVGTELRILKHAAKLIEARMTGLEEQAESLLRNGQRVNGYYLAPGQSRLQWTADAEDVAALGDALNFTLRKPLAVITPTQAKALGIDEAVIASYATRPPGKMKLTDDSTVETRKIFGDILV